jgi:hypothetical protein
MPLINGCLTQPRALSSLVIAPTFLFAVGAEAQAAVYVPQVRGSNQNPGTKEQPGNEIDRAVAIAAAGNAIYIAGGVCTGTFGIGYLDTRGWTKNLLVG